MDAAPRPLVIAVLLLGAAPVLARAGDGPVQFNRDIRPLLAENCFSCHGPDARNRRAALRLDVESAAKAELETGFRAIVPGRPDESELLARVEEDVTAGRMPPPETGKSLTASQVDLLRRWIAEGAVWEGHWSFQPISRPAPPRDPEGAAPSAIDAFLAEKLREQGLAPVEPADRVTLLRRVSFDLVGLPPSRAEVAAFLEDESPEAFERVVDRLLASPHFGERLAIGWLDLVRYADSVGLYADQPVRVAPYRDWVIAALNANMPFDRFTIEQLAGDLLPARSTDQRIASAYNRLGRMSTESGVQEKEYLTRYIAERARNVGTTWLGVTLGCCECHDHKYDPFTARDFYRMTAYFADIKEQGVYDNDSNFGYDWGPMLHLGRPEVLAEFERLDGEISALKKQIERHRHEHREPSRALAARIAAWEAALRPTYAWTALQPTAAASAAGATCRVQADQSIVVSGAHPDTDEYIVRVRSPLPKFSAVRLEALPDPTLPGDGPGRGESGDFVLSGLTLRAGEFADPSRREVTFRRASASFEQTDAPGNVVARVWSALSAVRPDLAAPELGWAITDRTGSRQEAYFQADQEVACGVGGLLVFKISQQRGQRRALGRFRLAITDAPGEVNYYREALPAKICRILSTPADGRNEEQRRELGVYYAENVSEVGRSLQRRLNEADEKIRRLYKREIRSVVAVESVEPRPIRVLPRGNWQDESGTLVGPGVPAVLPQPPPDSQRPTRLDLAQWIVSPQNPLTARVLANRLWKLCFGEALSRKVDDLGSQGEWPTHPELLDWLSGRLIDSGWDLKQTIRLMVTSEAYRRASAPAPEARERDPENRWLSHQNRFRLDAELVRDNALAASTLLAPQIGGDSVFPYQPDGYWNHLEKPSREWRESDGEGVYRRGVYTHWQRQYLHPLLLAFDAPSREECAASRARSSTPMQSLALLNDPTFVEAARVLAQRALLTPAETADERLDWLYHEVLSRQPRESERSALNELLSAHRARYREQPGDADKLLRVGRRPVDGDPSDRPEIAAWTNVARVVLNLHDAVTRK